MAMRVIARIDDDLARRVEHLRRKTGKTMSQLVKEGLAQLCDADAQAGNAHQRLLAAGFVACGDGPDDLSERYKEVLADTLRRKT
jgi:hypothetical protein